MKLLRDHVTIAFFAVLLVIPAALSVRGYAGFDEHFIASVENRRPFVAPPISSGALATGGWERDVERNIADAFPLRTSIIRGYDRFRYLVFGELHPNFVIGGTNGWFFLNERNYIIGDVSDAVLTHVADVYEARSRWCEQRGIPYILLVAPNKSTIYRQFLPAGLFVAAPSLLDRLLAMLRTRRVRTIDARAPLIEASQRGEVYSRGDTHWNSAGAFIAYAALVADLERLRVPVGAINARHIRQRLAVGGSDLLRLAGIADLRSNTWVTYDFTSRARVVPLSASEGLDSPGDFLSFGATESDGPARSHLVAFGDSFLNVLLPFLEASFRRVVFATDGTRQFAPQTIELEKPDVVLQEIVERDLSRGGSFQTEIATND